MNRVLRGFLKALWRVTTPLRLPLARKFDAHIDTILTRTIRAHVSPALGAPVLGAVELVHQAVTVTHHAVHATHQDVQHTARLQAGDVNLVLNSLIREVARLQMQVEILQQRNRETPPGGHGDGGAGEVEGGGLRPSRNIGHPAHNLGS